jgi:4-amino-4-deoxy-L-arabinose transferase-like glycosyltransferase
LLALPRLLFGDNPFAARLLLVLVGTLGCGLTYWFGRELSSDAAGLIAAGYTAISPSIALFSVLFLSETAFAVTLVASLIAAAKLLRPRTDHAHLSYSIWMAIVTGVLMGLATYMRPTWILVAPGIGLLFILFGKPPLRQRWIVATGLVAGLAITLAPWTIRNAFVTGHIVPTTLWVGPSLYDGLNPEAMGDSNMEFFERDNLLKKMSEYDMDREYRRRAWEFAAEHPARTVWLAMVKQSRYWTPNPTTPQFSGFVFQTIGWLSFLPLIIFALVGAWYGRHDLWLMVLTAAPIFYFAAIHLLFVGSLRYRLPAEYPLAVLSALGICQVLHLGNKRTVPAVEDGIV